MHVQFENMVELNLASIAVLTINYFVEYNKLNMFIPWRSGNCWVTKPIFIHNIDVEIRAIYTFHKNS